MRRFICLPSARQDYVAAFTPQGRLIVVLFTDDDDILAKGEVDLKKHELNPTCCDHMNTEREIFKVVELIRFLA